MKKVDNYMIENEIGQGSFSKVFKGVDTKNG